MKPERVCGDAHGVFVALPLALRVTGFWPALALSCCATALAYAAWVGGARLLGYDL